MLLGVLGLFLAPSHAADVAIKGVTASSEYRGGGVEYPPRAVHDGKSASPWFEGARGNGVGSWIALDLGGEQDVARISMLAGDWTSGTKWRQANRPKELEIQWADGSTELWTLADEWARQVFTPASPKKTSTIRFKINSVYSGSAFPDTAISEIQVFDSKPSEHVRIVGATSSSTFPSDGDGDYSPSQVFDGISDTFWCEGVEDGDGVGEWLEVSFGGQKKVSRAEICPGMCGMKSADAKRANHPQTVSLVFSDGSTEQVKFSPFPGFPKKVTFTPRTTSSVKVRIDSANKGTDYNDTCLSEIKFFP